MKEVKVDKRTLEKFSLTMFIALSILGSFLGFKHKENYFWFYSIGFLFIFAGFINANFLQAIYKGWIRLAFILAWINTRLLLLILFYLVFAPIGIILRLFGLDLLDKR